MSKKQPVSVKSLLRVRIYTMLTFFILISLGVLIVSLRSDLENVRSSADKDNHETALQIQENAIRYLDRIRNYYLAASKDDRVVWLLENNHNEKMCKEILDAASILAGNQLINDDINQYALVNYSNMKVLSRKGFFRVREMVNADEIRALYEEYKNRKNNGWIYLPSGTSSDTLAPEYRLTVDTEGMNLMLPLPMNSVRLKGMLLIQLNERKFYQALKACLGARQDLVLMDDLGKVVFSSDAEWTNEVLQAMGNGSRTSGVTIQSQGVKRTAEEVVLPYFNWHAIVLTTVDPVTTIPGIRYILLLLFLGSSIAFMISFLIFSYLRPMEKINAMVEGKKAMDLKDVADHMKAMKEKQVVMSEKIREQAQSQKELEERKLIHGEIPDAQIAEQFLPYSIFYGKYYLLTSMVLHRPNEEIPVDHQLEKNAFKEMWEYLQKRYSEDLKWHPVYVRSAFWTLVEAESEVELKSKASRYIRSVEDYFFEVKKVFLNTGMSDIHQDAAEFQEAMSECIYAMNRYIPQALTESSHVSKYGKVLEASFSGIDHSIEQKIHSVIADGNKEEAQALCSEYFSLIEQKKMSRDAQMNEICLFVARFSSVLNEAGLDAENMYGATMHEVYHTLSELYDLVKIRRYIKYNLIETAWKKLENITVEKNNLLLKQVEGLLEKRNGDITLSELSDELKIPPSTVWKALKKEEGMTFSEYQEMYKLEKAKKLLLETDLLVSEIAAELKYTNAQNFIRFFSKAEGMTPGNYRKNFKK